LFSGASMRGLTNDAYKETDMPDLAYRTTTRARRLKAVPPKYKKFYLRVLDDKRPCTPRQAIKAMCLECVGWSQKEVELCPATACPLWDHRPFKLGV
jgi:hypothetical protein